MLAACPLGQSDTGFTVGGGVPEGVLTCGETVQSLSVALIPKLIVWLGEPRLAEFPGSAS